MAPGKTPETWSTLQSSYTIQYTYFFIFCKSKFYTIISCNFSTLLYSRILMRSFMIIVLCCSTLVKSGAPCMYILKFSETFVSENFNFSGQQKYILDSQLLIRVMIFLLWEFLVFFFQVIFENLAMIFLWFIYFLVHHSYSAI